LSHTQPNGATNTGHPRVDLDTERLLQALALAESAIGITEPNPRVGCVIGSEAGAIFGRGATQRAGEAHAEVMALRDAAAAGHNVKGATAWVTLEPCAHHGRTPPCCDALIAAGIARVVAALPDPFPQVAGAGIERLRAAGIRVDTAPPAVTGPAWELNIGFFSRVLRGRPWTRLKMAVSLDGRTGLDNGVSQWITGADARADGHRWRQRAGAVLTGIGTVLVDDPRLDARLGDTTFSPLRVVVDSQRRLPPGARLLNPPGSVLVATAEPPAERAAPGPANVELINLPNAHGRVDLERLLHELGTRGINELHVECGPVLAGSLLTAGLVDELLVYMAPRLLGGQRGLVDWPPLQTLSDGLAFDWLETCPVGRDLRLRLRALRSGAFGPHALRDPSMPFTTALTPE